MKEYLSSVDLYYLVKELGVLVGARLDKAYQGLAARKHDFTLQFHKSGEGKLLFRILLPGIAYLASEKPAYEQLPGQFALFLRRRAGNARVTSVAQRGFERILELRLEKKECWFTLIIELLPPGNLLLLDEKGRILNLCAPHRTSARVLRGGVAYEPPPPQFDTRGASEEAIVERLFTTEKDSVVKALAIDLGLGGAYAEEACARARVEKTLRKPSREELARVARAIRSLFEEEPTPFFEGEEAFPFAMITRRGERLSSFSEGVERLAPHPITSEAVVARAGREARERALSVVERQEAALKGFLRAAEENQRKGELLYEHYSEVAALLERIREARKRGGWEAVRRLDSRIVKVDPEKGLVTIELGSG